MDFTGNTIRAWGILTEKVTNWLKGAVALLPNLFVAILVMVLFVLLARLATKLLARFMNRVSHSHPVSQLILNIVSSLILIFGLFTALGILNLDRTVASLLAGAGVIGLAIGFAFQEIAANFFSGALIALRKPYREEDIVEVDNHVGVVDAITLRTTNLRTFQGLEVLVPNKDMFTKPVINYTKTPDRRVDLDVGISYGDDLRKVEKVVREAVENIKGRLPDKETEFYYTEFADSSINFQVRFWIEFHKQIDYLAAVHEAIINIKEAFDKNDIMIPFPIRTLDFGIKGGEKLNVPLMEAYDKFRGAAEGACDSSTPPQNSSDRSKDTHTYDP